MASEGPNGEGAVPWGAARPADNAPAGQVAQEGPAEKKKWKEKLGLKGKGKKGKAAGKGADAEAAPPPPDLAGEGSTGQGDREKDIGKLMEAMTRTLANADMRGARGVPSNKDLEAAAKAAHAFWETQPVTQFSAERSAPELPEGPIQPPQKVEDVRQEPYKLPSAYEWCTCDVNDAQEIVEVYTLLTNNYVEDDDNMFRFDYSKEFLRWALKLPGYTPQWHIGVRAKTSKKLVAFISGVPARIRVQAAVVRMVEINFLCVHKKLRSKRLAPVLIREITRRVHLRDTWQAVYTAGVVLPKPLATCRYWHRSLNPKKLIDVGFSRLARNMTMARTIKLYKLPEQPLSPGIRPMQPADVPAVTALLTNYLQQFAIAPVLSEEEVGHLLLPAAGVVSSYVIGGEGGRVSDLCSFYTLPSSIIGNPEHSTLKAAYSFYTVATSVPLEQLMTDGLILAKQDDFDVFNALDIQHNESFLKDLKFGPGDGFLHYYLYNWRLNKELQPRQVGLVML